MKTNLIYEKDRRVLIDSSAPYNTKKVTQDDLDTFLDHDVKLFPKEYYLGGIEEEWDEPKSCFLWNELEDEENHQSKPIEKTIKQRCKDGCIPVPKKQPIMLKSVRETSLFFNSNFESGNLQEVERVSEHEYNLVLTYDTNTTIYTQWYYFAVMNVKGGNSYKFNICNLVKEESSYVHGMKPFVYSVKNNQKTGAMWKRGCFDVSYQRNQRKTVDRESAPDYEYDEENVPCYIFDDEESKLISLSTLSFSYTFENDLDMVYFAHF